MPEAKSEPTLQLLSLTGCPIPNPMCEKCDNPNGNKISLKTVGELLGKNFFVPSYQRGYRWTRQEVKDLLDDIYEFKKGENGGEFYCLQPLVVKSRGKDEYEVIDGQQRLTTIFIILKFLQKSLGESQKYSLTYETREESKVFLESLGSKSESIHVGEKEIKPEDNIDFFHMSWAYKTIEKTIEGWFKGKSEDDKEDFLLNFLLKLLNDVQFIWYETDESDPIKVFTRLNIGKIPLTNAELIKALFLNSSNFEKDDHIKLRQREIASEWDQIEYTLQNEEFWLFIHNKGYNNPTRIDFIFDIICERESDPVNTTGIDSYRTFRYFYKVFKENKGSFLERWKEVKKIFQTFNEWFNDLELYHYVGYLVDRGKEIKGLYKDWTESKNKNDFVDKLKKKIEKEVENINYLGQQYKFDSDTEPDDGNVPEADTTSGKGEKLLDKRACRPLLLLHNIQTVINQCKNSTKTYGMQVFHKFPFHIYKNENWDVEHIDSNTPNDLDTPEDQRGWLFAVKDKVKKGSEVYENASNVYNSLGKDNKGKKNNFEDLKRKIEGALKENNKSKEKNKKLSQKDKNKIWNFALLDASTNRGYGNSIFSAKRRCIIGKDKGKEIILPDEWDGELEEEDAESSFIPPCTKYVFLKYYSPASPDPNSWTRQDAENYRKNIFETLEEFGVKNADKSTGNTNKGDEDE